MRLLNIIDIEKEDRPLIYPALILPGLVLLYVIKSIYSIYVLQEQGTEIMIRLLLFIISGLFTGFWLFVLSLKALKMVRNHNRPKSKLSMP